MAGVRFWIVLGLACAMFFGRLDAGLLEPQEPRYAEIAREMHLADSWVIPVLHDQPYLDKPPLFYWAIIASYRLFGVHDWAARLVPAIAGVLTIVTVGAWGCSLFGSVTGFWAAVVLSLSSRFVYLERILTFDGLLCLWVTVALATGERAIRQTDSKNQEAGPLQLHHGWWMLSAIACGLGILTKGPVALALVVPPLLFLHRQFLSFLIYGLMTCLVAAPWFLAVFLKEPDFAYSFFWRHNVVRFVAPFDHLEPWWFHLPGLLLGMSPWILLLPGALRQPRVRFLLVASGWCLLFFSMAGCKRAVYILPALPPLALALSHQITLVSSRSSLPTLGSALVLIVALGISGIAGWNHLLPWILVGTMGSAASVGLLLVARDPTPNWTKTAIITGLILVPGVQVLLPAYNNQFALGAQIQAHQKRLDGEAMTVLCYPQSWDSVTFYAPDAKVRTFQAEEKEAFLQAIRSHPGALVLVRSGRWTKVLDDLPTDWEMLCEEKPGAVWSGWVRRREEQQNNDPGYHSVTQRGTPDRILSINGSN